MMGALPAAPGPNKDHDAIPAIVAPQSLRTFLLETGRPGAMMSKIRPAIAPLSIGDFISMIFSRVVLHQPHSRNAEAS
jgi:hypothetical protein